MFHMEANTIFHSIHHIPLHGKEGTGRNILSLGLGVHTISQAAVDGKVYG